MRWGKFILLFQAVITLVIGIVFLLQMFQIETYRVDKAKQLANLELPDGVDTSQFPQFEKIQDLSYRFNTAGYVLFTIAAIELIIIWRLTA